MNSEQARQLGTAADSEPAGGTSPGSAYRLGDDFERLKYAKIMMVDDEPITMEVVQAFLEEAGYRKFVLVEDSTQAIQQLHEHHPDVLLLDVVMPEVSGFDILEALRRETEFNHMPVIILTSSSDAETKLKALDLGATDFLSKPVDPSELSLRVRNTLAAKAYQDHLAYYDALTNLPNRHLFQDRVSWSIEKAERDGNNVAMLHIAFNDFKRVTDTFGPKIGDEVLKQLAERLTGCVRSVDTVSRQLPQQAGWNDVFRLGSADFSVLLPSVGGVSSAAAIGQRIIKAMRKPLDAEGTEVYLTPSIGVAGYPDDATESATLVKLAMGASSQAADHGGSRLQFYSAELNHASLQRIRMEADLRRAIAKHDFQMLYQPKVDVANGRIIGAEALIRWRREDGSRTSPVQFIPVAEEAGLILPIGEWALREACAQMVRWRDQGLSLKVSVNISARQFFEAELVALVSSLLAKTQLDPKLLVLEMTESILIDRVDDAVEILAQLRALGVEISIDDFGTGYSSLSYLKRFQMDEVKIDRSFITDLTRSPEDQALVYAVNYLAHKLGFRVCAEGVEEEGQLAFLREIACDEYQGFLFSRPVEPAEFVTRWQAQNA